MLDCLRIKELHAATIHATVSFDFQREYQKQRKETIDNYRGFQTMDSSDHPVVQRGIKAAELISDVSDEVKPLIQEFKETCFQIFSFWWMEICGF